MGGDPDGQAQPPILLARAAGGLELRGPDLDESELGRDEKGVGRDEQEDGENPPPTYLNHISANIFPRYRMSRIMARRERVGALTSPGIPIL